MLDYIKAVWVYCLVQKTEGASFNSFVNAYGRFRQAYNVLRAEQRFPVTDRKASTAALIAAPIPVYIKISPRAPFYLSISTRNVHQTVRQTEQAF